MATSWNGIYEKFYGKIEKDNDFFSYFNLTTAEAIDIATTRAKNYLIESISKLTMYCTAEIDFNDYNETAQEFTEDLTPNEIDLLANLMREVYFEKDFSLLKAMRVNFTTKDLNMFSPANERKTFIEMFEGIVKRNLTLLKQYSSRDRLTGKLKSIDYNKYNSDS